MRFRFSPPPPPRSLEEAARILSHQNATLRDELTGVLADKSALLALVDSAKETCEKALLEKNAMMSEMEAVLRQLALSKGGAQN
jgi:hypothetical protein